jgi:hypothetical protein
MKIETSLLSNPVGCGGLLLMESSGFPFSWQLPETCRALKNEIISLLIHIGPGND